MGDDPATHEVDQQRCEPRLHHVPAEHNDYAALATLCLHYGVYDAHEVTRDEHIRKRGEKRRERSLAVGRRRRELFGAYLVGSPCNRHGPYGSEVRFAMSHGGGDTVGIVRVGGCADFRYRLSEPTGRSALS